MKRTRNTDFLVKRYSEKLSEQYGMEIEIVEYGTRFIEDEESLMNEHIINIPLYLDHNIGMYESKYGKLDRERHKAFVHADYFQEYQTIRVYICSKI